MEPQLLRQVQNSVCPDCDSRPPDHRRKRSLAGNIELIKLSITNLAHDAITDKIPASTFGARWWTAKSIGDTNRPASKKEGITAWTWN